MKLQILLYPSWLTFVLVLFGVFPVNLPVHAQCPNTGQTKVFNSKQEIGYYFYRFLGDSSFAFFLSGKTFSFNEKDDPGKTFIFIDDIAYESTLVNEADIAKHAKSSKAEDILGAQAKQEQDYFKKAVPSLVITDYGPSAMKNADGSDGRLFYLWKKDNPAGSKSAPQYLVSTLVSKGVVVLSLMPAKDPVTEEDMFLHIQSYTSHFDLLTGERCASVLSKPTGL